MASAHAIAFSDRVGGLGHYMAAPFGCSRLINLTSEDYNERCSNSTASSDMLAYVYDSFSRRRIADPANLRDTPVFVYAGGDDSIVDPDVGKTAASLYTQLLANVSFFMLPGAEHAFAIDSSCATLCPRCSLPNQKSHVAPLRPCPPHSYASVGARPATIATT
jgi:pimeloyl-ACP methyl ester carboxylesterase